MNASFSPESLAQTSAADWSQGSRQAPSVPISVYRELATELKATQALVDSLTQQNQQLGQQNLFLRQEMLKFAESAAQLKQVVDGRSATNGADVQLSHSLQPITVDSPLTTDPQSATATIDSLRAESDARLSSGGVSQIASQVTQMFSPKPNMVKGASQTIKPKAKRPQPQPRVLYTEERLDTLRPGQGRERNADLSGLWLAATILLIVVSAFGAGFLIMKPLLNSSR
ncbi:MAG: hypothetical protein RLZZ597_1587 [Cyanobacteriota bacterium]|jgi:hypothetical protein